MAEKDVELGIGADISGLTAAIRQGVSEVRAGVGRMKESLEGLHSGFEVLSKGFAIATAVLAGGEMFKEAIEETKKLVTESMNLGRSMGISTSEASGYATALDEVGGSTDEFANASLGLTRQLKKNEEGLNQMGIVTRDASGNLRNMKDIMFEAITEVNAYAEGTDRNLAAQTAFGRGASANSAIFRLTREGMDEAAKSADELGLIVGTQSVEAFTENRKAMAEAHDVMLGIEKAVGEAVMPVLTQLAEWFRDIGPAAVIVIKGAVGGLVSVFWGLYAAVKIVWDLMKAMVMSVAEPMYRLAEAMFNLGRGDFSAAMHAFDGMGASLKGTWSTALDDIVADATKARDRIFNLFASQDPTSAPAKGKSFSLAAPGSENRLAEWKAELERIKEAEGEFRKHDIQADVDFWARKLELVRGSTTKDKALRLQIEHEIYQLRQKALEEQKKLDEEAVTQRRQIALLDIENQRELLHTQVELGLMTRAEELAAERTLENQKYEIERKALQDRLKLVEADKLQRAKILGELELLERQHQNAITKLDNQALLQQRKHWLDFFHGLESGFRQVIAGFLQGTRTLGQLVKGIFDAIVGSIANVLSEIAVKWLENQIMTRLLGKQTAGSQIAGNAGAAATAAMASVAAIPIYGWAMAPAVGASTFALAMGYESVLSAASGFDIPAGVNPLVQLHEKEMVLPASLADPFRNLVAGPPSSGGSVKLKTERLSATHDIVRRQDLAQALRKLNARFAL